jgi:putative DNA primase/helicase
MRITERKETMSEPPPPVFATQSTTGLGKTSIFVEEVANDRLHPRPDGAPEMYKLPWGYLTPTHRLGENVASLFRAQGLTASVIRSRDALSADGEPMCTNLEQVQLAKDFHAGIQETCCKGKDAKGKEWQCPFFVGCLYQAQFPDNLPDVFIVAHQMMFHAQKRFGEFAAIGIDESFWEAGLWGIGKDESNWTIEIEQIANREIPDDFYDHLANLRKMLAELLQQQIGVGGVRSDIFDPSDGVFQLSPRNFLEAEECGEAIRWEWRLMPKIEIVPGMSPAAIKNFYVTNKQKLQDRRFARRMIALWEALNDFLKRKDSAVSGRIIIKEFDRKRVVAVRGVWPVRKQWQVTTMIMDATLPALPMLQAYFPQVEVGEPIEADPPECVVVRQVLKAPVSARRLINNTKSDVNRKTLRRYVLRRWIETGRQPTLVICQMDYEDWLKDSGLPENITVEHYNNVAGLDDYKDVRLLILIGRVIPGPEAVETYAGVLTGEEPKKLPHGSWYRKVRRGIRLPDGSGVAVDCDEHPDPVAEMVRFQLCEAELIQAIGRGRAINRTAETPLDIDIVADVCLPITVNEVSMWWKQRPSPMVEAVADGVVLTARVDMVKAWPHVWDNDTAARRTLEELRKERKVVEKLIEGWQTVTYQLEGPKMNQRVGYFDPAMIPDPRAWLEARLGQLKVFADGGPTLGEVLIGG